MSGGETTHLVQQLVELLAVVSTCTDEGTAAQAAVERAAATLEAEVAALVSGDRVIASVGFGRADLPDDALREVVRGERSELEVPGIGTCSAASAALHRGAQSHLVLARWGGGFTVAERNLLRGMARIVDLTLAMLRTVETERRQRLLMNELYTVQRAISRRIGLEDVLEMIVQSTQELVGGGRDTAALWLLASDGEEAVRAFSVEGTDAPRSENRLPVTGANAVGRSVLGEHLVTVPEDGGAVVRSPTDGDTRRSMATPVYESGRTAGALEIVRERDRAFDAVDREALLAFAEHVSLAMTDAKTPDDMYRAFHDPLTGLPSRALFMDQLRQCLRQVTTERSRVALLFIDLDLFKQVNDSFGHAVGDLLLVQVTERLRAQLRQEDIAARFGGDEFVALLQGISGLPQVDEIARRISAAIEEPFDLAGRRIRIGSSIGVAVADRDEQDAEDLVHRADTAMYRAKRNGRNRVEVHEHRPMIDPSTAALGGRAS